MELFEAQVTSSQYLGRSLWLRSYLIIYSLRLPLRQVENERQASWPFLSPRASKQSAVTAAVNLASQSSSNLQAISRMNLFISVQHLQAAGSWHSFLHILCFGWLPPWYVTGFKALKAVGFLTRSNECFTSYIISVFWSSSIFLGCANEVYSVLSFRNSNSRKDRQILNNSSRLILEVWWIFIILEVAVHQYTHTIAVTSSKIAGPFEISHGSMILS